LKAAFLFNAGLNYLQTQADVTFEQVALLLHLAWLQAVQVVFFAAFLTGTLPSANAVVHAINAIATPNAIFFMFKYIIKFLKV